MFLGARAQRLLAVSLPSPSPCSRCLQPRFSAGSRFCSRRRSAPSPLSSSPDVRPLLRYTRPLCRPVGHFVVQQHWRQRLRSAAFSTSSVSSSSSARAFAAAQDTIYALSSAIGRAGVAVIRISGPHSLQCAAALAQQPDPSAFVDRRASLRRLYHPSTHELLDTAIVLPFRAPHSFTGEDVVELHVHGSRAVVSEVLSALSSFSEVRAADAGEFTMRAFQRGRMDLTEVEGLADLLAAETSAQRKQALRQLSGELSALYTSWRTVLVECMAQIEAVIDFGEDAGIDDEVARQVTARVETLARQIDDHLRDGRRGERLRHGAELAIVGPPNAGSTWRTLLLRLQHVFYA